MLPIRFSIIITSHNQREFIRGAVESALSQPYLLKEIIVIDDGSSDGSVELLEQFADSIRLIKFSSNRGAIEARNEGARQARGQYLVFLDGDDVLRRWALCVYECLIIERSPKIIAAESLWFQGEVPVQRDKEVPQKIEFIQYGTFLSKDRSYGMSASTWIMERRAFEEVGGWTAGIFHLDSVDLVMKLRDVGPVILVCSPSTVFYRVHTANSIHSVPPFIDMLHRLIRKERAGEYPGGPQYQFQRHAFLGGLVFFWVKRGLRAGLYKEVCVLLASGAPLVAAGFASRVGARIRKLRPIEAVSMPISGPAPDEQIVNGEPAIAASKSSFRC
jgi:glycosyltransferase involved in cell wall biosynthesis